MRATASLLLVFAVCACGTGAGSGPSATTDATGGAPQRSPAVASASAIPLLQAGTSHEAAEFLALANALNAAMSAIPQPERTLEQVTAAYWMQAAVMEAFADGLDRIEWPALARADIGRLTELARKDQFYVAALGRAPSMAVVEVLEARREASTAGWQNAVDAVARDFQVQVGPEPTLLP